MLIGKLKNVPTTLQVAGAQVDPVIKFADSLDLAKYDDITSISNWREYGELSNFDFLYIRDQIATLVASIGFSNLSTADKITASELFVVSSTDRDTVMSANEQKGAWRTFVIWSEKVRTKRWDYAKSYISYELSPIAGLDLAKSTDQLSIDYKIYGIESNAIDGLDGLFDYLEGTSSYVGGGFPAKAYWTQAHQDAIMTILRDGIY